MKSRKSADVVHSSAESGGVFMKCFFVSFANHQVGLGVARWIRNKLVLLRLRMTDGATKSCRRIEVGETHII